MTYIVTQSGSMEAEGGCYDDCVMSLALVNHIHEGAWDPIPSDEFYTEDGLNSMADISTYKELSEDEIVVMLDNNIQSSVGYLMVSL